MGIGLFFILIITTVMSGCANQTGIEASFYEKLDNYRVHCQLCFKNCIIPEGRRSFCRVRENRGGILYSLVYGMPATLQIDPIELEPMYHMLPGHRNLCVATASCNFRCPHCQNWHITQRDPEDVHSFSASPEEVVETAIRNRCLSISHSINEPAIFYEYMYDIARLAQKRGLKTLFHTNGSLNEEPLRELLKWMDGVTVDLKGFTEEFYNEVVSGDLGTVLNNLKVIREEGVWLEIVNLIIPTLNDNPDDIRRMCEWIREHLGKETPLHFSRFSPAYKLTRLPKTPIETLEKAHSIARDVGLEYVTIGNVPGHKYNSTFCPECNSRLIHRVHFKVLANNIEDGRCGYCGHKIPGIWE